MIYEIYSFLRGPMVWVAFYGILFAGSIYRLVSMWRLAKKERHQSYLNYISVYYALTLGPSLDFPRLAAVNHEASIRQ